MIHPFVAPFSANTPHNQRLIVNSGEQVYCWDPAQRSLHTLRLGKDLEVVPESEIALTAHDGNDLGNISAIYPSPSGRKLALVAAAGTVTVLSLPSALKSAGASLAGQSAALCNTQTLIPEGSRPVVDLIWHHSALEDSSLVVLRTDMLEVFDLHEDPEDHAIKANAYVAYSRNNARSVASGSGEGWGMFSFVVATDDGTVHCAGPFIPHRCVVGASSFHRLRESIDAEVSDLEDLRGSVGSAAGGVGGQQRHLRRQQELLHYIDRCLVHRLGPLRVGTVNTRECNDVLEPRRSVSAAVGRDDNNSADHDIIGIVRLSSRIGAYAIVGASGLCSVLVLPEIILGATSSRGSSTPPGPGAGRALISSYNQEQPQSVMEAENPLDIIVYDTVVLDGVLFDQCTLLTSGDRIGLPTSVFISHGYGVTELQCGAIALLERSLLSPTEGANDLQSAGTGSSALNQFPAITSASVTATPMMAQRGMVLSQSRSGQQSQTVNTPAPRQFPGIARRDLLFIDHSTRRLRPVLYLSSPADGTSTAGRPRGVVRAVAFDENNGGRAMVVSDADGLIGAYFAEDQAMRVASGSRGFGSAGAAQTPAGTSPSKHGKAFASKNLNFLLDHESLKHTQTLLVAPPRVPTVGPTLREAQSEADRLRYIAEASLGLEDGVLLPVQRAAEELAARTALLALASKELAERRHAIALAVSSSSERAQTLSGDISALVERQARISARCEAMTQALTSIPRPLSEAEEKHSDEVRQMRTDSHLLVLRGERAIARARSVISEHRSKQAQRSDLRQTRVMLGHYYGRQVPGAKAFSPTLSGGGGAGGLRPKSPMAGSGTASHTPFTPQRSRLTTTSKAPYTPSSPLGTPSPSKLAVGRDGVQSPALPPPTLTENDLVRVQECLQDTAATIRQIQRYLEPLQVAMGA
eukprot:Clim_evm1s167 gene=Clim_evmTU1s167